MHVHRKEPCSPRAVSLENVHSSTHKPTKKKPLVFLSESFFYVSQVLCAYAENNKCALESWILNKEFSSFNGMYVWIQIIWLAFYRTECLPNGAWASWGVNHHDYGCHLLSWLSQTKVHVGLHAHYSEPSDGVANAWGRDAALLVPEFLLPSVSEPCPCRLCTDSFSRVPQFQRTCHPQVAAYRVVGPSCSTHHFTTRVAYKNQESKLCACVVLTAHFL